MFCPREPVCSGGPSFARAVPPVGRLHPARVLHHVEGVVQGHGGLSRRVDTFPREIGKQRFSSSRVGLVTVLSPIRLCNESRMLADVPSNFTWLFSKIYLTSIKVPRYTEIEYVHGVKMMIASYMLELNI